MPRLRSRFAVLPAVATGLLALCGVVLVLPGCGGPPAPGGTEPGIVGKQEETGPPIFEDVTKLSGIDFTYRNGEEANNYAIIESLGGGVALFDYDRDGLPDVFVGGGGYFKEKEVLGHPGKLYRNLGQFKFRDVSADVGLDKPLQYSHGAAAFDYDCDGWLDLVVSGYNRLVLLHNESDGKDGRKFVDKTPKSGLDGDTLWSTSTAWGDLNGDGKPELYVCHYGNWGFAGVGPDGKSYRHPTDCNYDGKTRDVCQPAKFDPLPHSLYQNNGDGTFTDISKATGLRPGGLKSPTSVGGGRGIGVVMTDVDNDGRPDVYTANDTDDNFLYLNQGVTATALPKLFEDGMRAGVALDDRGSANGSMGLGVSDFDRSGRASLVVTNYESELPALYQNRTDPGKPVRFAYATQSSGLGTLNGVFVSWGTGFADFDLNGWDDLYIVNGHAIRHPSDKKGGREMRPSLLLNEKGKLTIRTGRGGSFFADRHNARGSAVGDLDNDGRPDLVVVRHNAPVVVLKNIAPTEGKHWVGVTLSGKGNRDLVGSRVVIETAGGVQTKFVTGGASYGSTNDRRLLFGLGADEKVVKATVYWSHGKSEEISGLTADSYFTVTEGKPEATK